MNKHGTDIRSLLHFIASKTAIAITQLIQHNCHAGIQEAAACHRHLKTLKHHFEFVILFL